ncbi:MULTISPECIES: hypothetical protein [unclassified Marinomonas]|nr:MULTISPECIES: hypothetical protein [unclassified Marinomonas]
MKKFFTGKLVKFIASAAVTSALIYVGVPAPVATQAGNTVGEQAVELVN